MSLCVRYISLDGDIQILEEFLQFIPVVDMRGGGPRQNYFWPFKWCQSTYFKKYPSAIYVHCASHSLNLAISDSCALPSIRNSMAIISKIYDFFKYPKR
ncbi:unnamed protein product [Gordionus sp. m RMFG-2023]